MAISLNEIFDGKATLPFFAQRPNVEYMTESVLPYQPVTSLEYEHLMGEFHLPIQATFTAFGAEGVYRGRDGMKKFIEELRPIKQGIKLDGKTLIQWKTAGAEEALLADLFNDIGMVYDGIRSRTEAMRVEVLTNGTLTVSEGGGTAFSVDYQVDADNKTIVSSGSHTAMGTWDTVTAANTNPISDMITWLDDLSFTPSGGIISTTIAKYLLTNVNVRKMVYGDDYGTRPITWTQFSNYIGSLGLPPLYVNRDKYRKADLTTGNFWPDNKMTWVGDSVGYTLMGPTEEGVLGTGVVRTTNGIYVQVTEETKPPAIYSRASATSLVALPGAERIFIVQTHS